MALTSGTPRPRTLLWLLVGPLVGLAALAAFRLETPWRRAQAAYFDAVLEASRAELAVLRARRGDDLKFLEGEVQVARDRLPAAELDEAERRLRALERKLRRAAPGREAESFRELVRAQTGVVDELLAEVREAEDELAEARAPLAELEQRIEALDGVGGWLRRMPVLRALGSGVEMRELIPSSPLAWPEGSAEGRPERCITCHLSMDPSLRAPSPGTVRALGTPSADDRWGALWAPHPSPDLFVAAGSHHDVLDFGCTSCHGGDGFATDYVAAGHGPRRAQAPRPILAGARVESACVACHDAPWLPGAPVAEAGRGLARSMACAACHETGRPDLEPQVPSLADLPETRRPEWVRSFLATPSSARLSFMPHFWDDADPVEARLEIEALVSWLYESRLFESRPEEQPRADADAPGPDPDAAEAGRRRFHDLGCGACHVIEAGAPGAGVRREQFLGTQRLRGPSLASFGREIRPGVVETLLEGHRPAYAWRDGEVRELAAFLSSLQGSWPEDGEAVAVGSQEGRAGLLDDLLRRRLAEWITEEEAAAWLDRLDRTRSMQEEAVDDATRLLGALAARRYRCGSCHGLPAAAASRLAELDERLGADPRGPAPSLETVGERFAGRPFGGKSSAWPQGSADWPHPLASASASASMQRIGASSDPTLPRWRLAPAESEALAVQLAGWRERSFRGQRESGSEGRDAMARHGCRACHSLAEETPVDLFAGRSMAPPSLAQAGEKLRGQWIFRHLDEPATTAVRPWTVLRMPRFDLTDAERSAIAEFFAHRAGVAVLAPEPSTLRAGAAEERMLGEAVFGLLLCDSCHGEAAAMRAPDYGKSGDRLRLDWLRRRLLAPPAVSGMPVPFPLRDGSPDATYLLATLDAPMFRVHRERLERFFVARDDLERAFDDPEAVADALARHVLARDP